ncbi:MAG TPA: ectonucleotide pyrophosphatase/phosphodiesterase [Acidobacteriaceae bacterium]
MLVRAALAGLLLALPAVAQTAAPTAVITVDHGPNALLQEQKHYIVLVSLDGFRWDYARKYGARNLLAIAARGASAPEGMLPSYPSLTFPNHYTLVTGLYPEHHGIVANTFYDETHTHRYSSSDPASSLDGAWYAGAPLWVLAEQQGMRAACFFWPGSEAAIQGVRPTYYLHFNDKYPDEKRVDQVLAWLRLPAAQRPHFLTLYYSNVDTAGHEYGPDSAQTRAAVRHVDALIGTLRAGLSATHLPVDLVVVSDHGMQQQDPHWITLDTYANLANFVAAGPLLYANSEADAQLAYDRLKSADAAFMVYRRASLPASLHYSASARAGDPVIVPRGAFAIRAHAPAPGTEDKPPHLGAHGFDARDLPSMKAIFYAEGPDIRPGVQLKPFENVNVYPFLAQILRLQAPPVDGSLGVLSGALTESAQQ